MWRREHLPLGFIERQADGVEVRVACLLMHGGTIREVKVRGRRKVSDTFTLAMLAVNLRRLPKLMAAAAMVPSG